MIAPTHRRRLFVVVVVVVSATLLTSDRAWAFDLPGPDAAALGQGGAVVASPYVVSGCVLNPALLGLHPRTLRISAGVTVDSRRAVTRRLGYGPETTAEATPEPSALPMAVAVGSLGVYSLFAGAWYVERGGARAEFPGKDPNDPLTPSQWDRQRYGALRYRLRRHHFGLGLAWRPLPWLSIGVGIGGQWISLEHSRMISFTQGDDDAAERLQNDVQSTVKLKDEFVPVGLFGVFLRPWKPLRLGLSFELPGGAKLTGSGTLTQSGPYPNARVLIGEAAASLRLPLPWVLRVGLGVDVWRFAIDVSGTVTGAPPTRGLVADAKGLLVQPNAGQTEVFPMEILPLGVVLRRQFTLSFGLRVAILPRVLHLSAGYAFAQGETHPAYRTAALVAPDRHLATVGVSIQHKALRLDVAYARVIASTHSGTSKAFQTNLVEPSVSTNIGASRQRLDGDLIALTLSVDLALR
ncbi:MAG: hypothetical protein ABI333_24240 [bacterium]